MTAKLLLRPEEAAEVLGVGRTKVYELMAAGELESVQVGRSRRLPTAAVEAFVAGLRRVEPCPTCGACRAA
jgi:excisionase family DNA binding protein